MMTILVYLLLALLAGAVDIIWQLATRASRLDRKVAELQQDIIVLKDNWAVAAKANARYRDLMAMVTIREAPRSSVEIRQTFAVRTGLVSYIHPATLKKLLHWPQCPEGIHAYAGSRIVSTLLMPEHGVIYGPMQKTFETDLAVASPKTRFHVAIIDDPVNR